MLIETIKGDEKMITRPYTAVLINSVTRSVRVEQISAAYVRVLAKSEIETQFADHKVVALIPGHHAEGMSSFDLAPSTESGRYLDLFDNELGS